MSGVGVSLTVRTVVFAWLVFAACPEPRAGEVVVTAQGNLFREDFRFAGNHAASIAGGSATTVWWDEASWDARGDTTHVSVTPVSAGINNRFHIDVHKALGSDPRDGRLSNTVAQVGGDGSPGVGVMHLDFQDIVSARLRNPMLISAQQPGVVSFYAPLFNTTAHWWELAITPAGTVVGGESTAIPGQGEAGLPDGNGNNHQPGPGHPVAADSINLVSFGATDVPCGTGWYTRFGVTRSVGQVRSDYVNPVGSIADHYPTSPEHTDTLVLWRAEFRPNGVALYADFDGDGELTLAESWSLPVPWAEVHVHLIGVAYQADHHPQPPCYLGHIREMKWRDVEVFPVKYAATDVFPKNDQIALLPNTLGWRAYDLRDIQRFGPAVNGAPQPNTSEYTTANKGRYCNDAGYPCFGSQASAQFAAPVPARADLPLAAARFVYDAKRRQSTAAGGSLSIAGTSLGRMPGHDTVPGSEWSAWIRRSVPVPVHLLVPGASVGVQIGLDSGLYLDRMEIELGYGTASDLLFRDGFELPGRMASKRAGSPMPPMPYVAPDRGQWRLGRVFGGATRTQHGWSLVAHCSAGTDAMAINPPEETGR